MQLQAWTYSSTEGFTLRGWHSQPSGKPLLHFLHGNGFCGLTYQPMLEALSQHFDLWLCDIQGHGDSDPGTEFIGWNRNAEAAMQAFIEGRKAFGDVACYAVGHSFGGVLSALAMAKRPSLFARAVLLDPVIFTPKIIWLKRLLALIGQQRRLALVQQTLRRRSQWTSREAARASLRGRGTYRGWDERALQAFAEHALRDLPDGQVELKCAPSLEASIFASAPEKLWSSLFKVQTPTLVLYGANSFPFVSQSAERWTRRNPQVHRQQVEGGHCFMQQHPDSTAEAVRRFLLEPAN